MNILIFNTVFVCVPVIEVFILVWFVGFSLSLPVEMIAWKDLTLT